MWIRFSAYAPASADSTSDCTQDFERLADSLARSAWWRGKPSPSRSWERRLRKGGWTTLLSGSEICENYPRMNSLEWTGSRAAIRVSPFPKLAKEPESLTPDIYGPSSINKCGLFDLGESSSKTSPGTSVWVSEMSSETWNSLVSLVRSACTQRRKSARLIDESESSSSGWPTPQTMNRKSRKAMTASTENGRRSGGGNSSTPGLEQAVEMSEGILPKELKGMSSDQVGPATRRLWPTPMARDHKDGDATANVPTNGHLGRAAPRDPTSHPGQLNPDWVEILMGFPIGWTASELSGTR